MIVRRLPQVLTWQPAPAAATTDLTFFVASNAAAFEAAMNASSTTVATSMLRPFRVRDVDQVASGKNKTLFVVEKLPSFLADFHLSLSWITEPQKDHLLFMALPDFG